MEYLAADVNDDMLPYIAHQVILPVQENAPQQEDDHDAGRYQVQHIGILCGKHLVDHIPEDPGQIQVAPCCQHGAYKGCKQYMQIWSDII